MHEESVVSKLPKRLASVKGDHFNATFLSMFSKGLRQSRLAPENGQHILAFSSVF